ncbi:hypothetical protein DSL72_004653 [Monilinia vaccinii-corymbosi]|uniref:Uncharacterized protein n=1 Tax=Monilinia vaccinii-corymbosi TaxID=61207 RepID=A0A8A3NX91_9HELO|nr:hypothetical protein DSL72_004653 [Monilinia vaccinii-corymbosi]
MSDRPEDNKAQAVAVAVAVFEGDDEPDECKLITDGPNSAGTNESSALDARVSRGSLEPSPAHEEGNEDINTKWNEEENAKMTDCYFEKRDWRLCKAEVRMDEREREEDGDWD